MEGAVRVLSCIVGLQECGLHPKQVGVGVGVLVALQDVGVAAGGEQLYRGRVFLEAGLHGEVGAGEQCGVACRVHPDVESSAAAVTAMRQGPDREARVVVTLPSGRNV